MEIPFMPNMAQLQTSSLGKSTMATGSSAPIFGNSFQHVLSQQMSDSPQDGPKILNNTYLAMMLKLSEPHNMAHAPAETPIAAQASSSVPAVTGPGKGKFDSFIEKAAKQYAVDSNLIRSVIKAESNFNSSAVSHAGAQGLMQLMPATARGLGVTNSFDPEQNIMGGTKFLKQMLDRYNGDTSLALAAYNAGPGNVDKYNGIPPFNETQNYVRKIMSTYSV